MDKTTDKTYSVDDGPFGRFSNPVFQLLPLEFVDVTERERFRSEVREVWQAQTVFGTALISRLRGRGRDYWHYQFVDCFPEICGSREDGEKLIWDKYVARLTKALRPVPKYELHSVARTQAGPEQDDSY